MTYQDDSKYINKAVTLLVTKDDCAAVCDVHIPLVESLEIGVGRAIPAREPLATPTDCAMCAARIAADAETIQSLDEQRLNNDRIMSNLRLWLAEARRERDEAREQNRAKDEDIERLTALVKKLGEPLLFLATGRPEDNVSPGLHEQLARALVAYEEWIAFRETIAATEPKG